MIHVSGGVREHWGSLVVKSVAVMAAILASGALLELVDAEDL
jgi:hypothetical protein